MNNIFDLINKKKASLSATKETLKPSDGNNIYVILPSWKGDNQPFWADWGRHWIKNELGEVQAVCTCSGVTGGRCEVCEALANAKMRYAETDPTLAKVVDQAYASHRILFNVLECKTVSTANGGTQISVGNPSDVKILELPKTAGMQVFDCLANLQMQGISDPFNFNSIYLINVIKTGKGIQNTKYQVNSMLKPIAFSPAQVQEIKANIKNLDEFVMDDPSNIQRALTAIRTITGEGPQAITSSPAQTLISNGQMNQATMVSPISENLNALLDDSIPYNVVTPSTTVENNGAVVQNIAPQAQMIVDTPTQTVMANTTNTIDVNAVATTAQTTVTETSPESLNAMLQF